jgi:hypothetical protein
VVSARGGLRRGLVAVVVALAECGAAEEPTQVANPDGAASPALEAAIHDRAAGWLFWYTIAMIIGFVFIMVVKPLS